MQLPKPEPSSTVPPCTCTLCPIHGGAPAGATATDVDELTEALSYVSVNPPTQPTGPTPPHVFRASDMLLDGEMADTDDYRMPDHIISKTSFYVVICGRLTGVFDEWSTANGLVTGYSGNCHVRRGTADAAWNEWRTACLAGSVTQPLHAQSLFQKVISSDILQQRADAANVAAFIQEIPPDTQTHATPASVTSPLPATEAAQPTVESESPGAGPSTSPTLVHPSNDVLDRGWVVIWGRQPGVYYNEDDWRNAQAVGMGGWAFPCASRKAAEDMFVAFQARMRVIE